MPVRKSLLRRACWSVVVGVVITIALAWYPAACGQLNWPGGVEFDHSVEFHICGPPAVDGYECWNGRQERGALGTAVVISRAAPYPHDGELWHLVCPGWTDVPGLVNLALPQSLLAPEGNEVKMRVGWGWPLRALSATCVGIPNWSGTDDAIGQWTTGIELPVGSPDGSHAMGPMLRVYWALPTQVIPFGFLVNVTTWGGTTLGLWSIVRSLGRRARAHSAHQEREAREKGVCALCGYQRGAKSGGSDACPECGSRIGLDRIALEASDARWHASELAWLRAATLALALLACDGLSDYVKSVVTRGQVSTLDAVQYLNLSHEGDRATAVAAFWNVGWRTIGVLTEAASLWCAVLVCFALARRPWRASDRRVLAMVVIAISAAITLVQLVRLVAPEPFTDSAAGGGYMWFQNRIWWELTWVGSFAPAIYILIARPVLSGATALWVRALAWSCIGVIVLQWLMLIPEFESWFREAQSQFPMPEYSMATLPAGVLSVVLCGATVLKAQSRGEPHARSTWRYCALLGTGLVLALIAAGPPLDALIVGLDRTTPWDTFYRQPTLPLATRVIVAYLSSLWWLIPWIYCRERWVWRVALVISLLSSVLMIVRVMQLSN